MDSTSPNINEEPSKETPMCCRVIGTSMIFSVQVRAAMYSEPKVVISKVVCNLEFQSISVILVEDASNRATAYKVASA